jgi:hypothetical protein
VKSRATSPLILITLLILAFAAGSLITYLVALSSSSSSPSLSPLPPTPIPASPTPLPTPTATAPDGGDVLETLYVDIAPADLDKIKAKREEALQLGILLTTGGDYVPATVRVGHHADETPVELRLKGDWADHFAYSKWSFRVRTQGEHYVFGMHVFSLQDPSTRTFLNEWAFLQNLRMEDVLTVSYRFVHVVLNGEYMGIYALEEGFSKELFEEQKRREGLIIRYDEDLVWEYRAFYDDQLIPRGVNEFHIIDDFESGRIARTPALAAQRDTAIGLLRALWTGDRTAAEVFDLEKMGIFLALSDLWKAPHGLIWHNLRYYYNPIMARLEPIAFDSDALAGDPSRVGLAQGDFYHDPVLQAAYVRELQRVSQPDYVETLETQLGPQFEALRTALEPEFGSEVLEPPWDVLQYRQGLIDQVLDPHQMVYAYVQRPPENCEPQTENCASEEMLKIDVGNLLELPVEIVGFEMNGISSPSSSDWVTSDITDLIVPADARNPDALVLRPLDPQSTHLSYVQLQVPITALTSTQDTHELSIVTRLWGLTTTLTQTVIPSYAPPLAKGPLPEAPSVAQALDQHPYLTRVEDEKMFRIPSGTWEINGDLMLPDGFGLRLEPGTTLRFGHDNYLLASGPLDFQGVADAPISLQPVGDQWNGIVVIQAETPSAWSHVTVERTSAISREGWILTGGITLYESPIRMTHSRILYSRAEDGINIIRTEFMFLQSEFAHTASDAFDADFTQGTIEECSFHDIGGDGFDLSGSDVQVDRVRLLDIGDKGISVGEASRLTGRDVYFEDVVFGLVSKDLSHATLEGATIVRAHQAGLAAYIKKPNYGPATITANDITFIEVSPEHHTLVQTGSWIDLEGTRIWGTDLDVSALY